MFGKQKIAQTAGKESTNLQAGRDVVVQVGVNIADVKEVVKDALRASMYEFRAEAEQVVSQRILEFSDMFVERMEMEDPALLEAVSDPDVQHVMIQAGIGYARTGDEGLGEVLIDLLADRARVKTRSLLAVVIDDAVSITPRLTDAEIAALHLFWQLASSRDLRVNTLDALTKFVHESIVPLIDELPKNEASYSHLAALGGVSIETGEIAPERPWLGNYEGLFSKGFLVEDVPEQVRDLLAIDTLFLPCLRDPSRLQVNAMTTVDTETELANIGRSDALQDMRELISSCLMNGDEVKVALIAIHPSMEKLWDIWSTTPMRSLRLTAVGIAIAHASYRRMSGDLTPLSIWINEDVSAFRA